MSEATIKTLEETIVVVEDNVIKFPEGMEIIPPSFLQADKEVFGIPIKFLYVRNHPDGTSGLYTRQGDRYMGVNDVQKMYVQCAWCKRYQNEQGIYDENFAPSERFYIVSHGMCEEDFGGFEI